jgi:hypothetical protein
MIMEKKYFSFNGYNSYKNHHSKFGQDILPPDGYVDAILVPQGRPAPAINRPARLAGRAETTLISLTSHDAVAKEVAEYIEGMGSGRPPISYAVDIPDGFEIPGVKLTAQEEIPGPGRKSKKFNLPEKRNAGLVIGKMTDMESLMYHDDDLYISLIALISVSQMLYRRHIAGLKNGGKEDRSVLQHGKLELIRHHTLRHLQDLYAGEKSGQASGNSMVVNPQKVDGMFPPGIYNEDTIFVHPSLEAGVSALTPDAKYLQDDYDPFQPKRAAEEEFGDIFADGLYTYADRWNGQDPLHSSKFWQSEIESRRREYEWQLDSLGAWRSPKIFGRADMTDYDPHYYDPMPEEKQIKIGEALKAGLAINLTLNGQDFTNYMHAWEEDRRRWNAMMEKLPDKQTIKQALSYLALDDYFTNVAA